MAEHQGPFFDSEDLDRVQGAYRESRYRHFAINEKFLASYAQEFKDLAFRKVKFYPDFVTEDGTHWYAVRVMFDTDDRWFILFPKGRDRHHEDGTVSSHHVAMYCDASDELSEEKVTKYARTASAIFEIARRDFRHSPK